MSTESKKPRLIFLDNIKVLFTILVIFTHVRVTYGGEGSWYYIATLNESNPADVISITILYLITGIGGLFLAATMGLFFLMAAYFTPKSYDRKGVSSFWKERLIRLCIPILLYILIINPIIAYLLASGGIQPYASYTRLQGSFIEYYLSNFQSLENFIGFMTDFSITWFLVVLLIFTAVYTFWRQITKIKSIEPHIPKELHIPKYIYLLLFSIGLGFLTFLLRLVVPVEQFPFGLPLAYMVPYLMMFSVGIIAYRYDWFEQMRRHHVKIWALTIFVAVILFFTYFFVFVGVDSDYTLFFGGPHLQALIYALVESINCMGMIFVLIKIFYAKFNKQGTFLKSFADNSFTIYLIHPFVVIPVSLGIAFIPLSPLIKIVIVLTTSVILCYLLSHYILERIHLRKNR
jgi:hypothetical protein